MVFFLGCCSFAAKDLVQTVDNLILGHIYIAEIATRTSNRYCTNACCIGTSIDFRTFKICCFFLEKSQGLHNLLVRFSDLIMFYWNDMRSCCHVISNYQNGWWLMFVAATRCILEAWKFEYSTLTISMQKED